MTDNNELHSPATNDENPVVIIHGAASATNSGKPVVVINDTASSAGEGDGGETPVITIERDNTHAPLRHPERRRGPVRRLLRYAAFGIAAALVVVAIYAAWREYCYYYRYGVPVSVTPEENIAKLRTATPTTGHITLSTDSVLGVALHLYALRGVRAELSMQEPDTTDTDVVLYSRSADYSATGECLGSAVVGGKALSSGASRLGYCAMADGRMVIGVSRFESVRDYCQAVGGSFFRQFVLVSNGELPARFHLHGKVERRAIGRMADDTLYYIVTPHPETMWDFADALRELGFIDAIYITGGTMPTWWRTNDGKRHVIGTPASPAPRRAASHAPWLVLLRAS